MTTHSVNWGQVVHLIHIDGIDADWSVAMLKDGRWVNRWEDSRDQFPERFEAAQEYINAQMLKDYALSGLTA